VSTAASTTASTPAVAQAPTVPVSEPNAVVVKVGNQAITKAAYAHALAIATRQEGPGTVTPVPPDFTACIAHLKASAPASTASGPRPSVADLKTECSEQFKSIQTRALDRLIVDDWTVGGAAELGVSVSEASVRKLVEGYEHEKSASALQARLALQDRTVADLEVEERVQLLGEGIRQVLGKRTSHITQAQVVAYYDQHKASFGTPERRVLEIARAATEKEALKVKREIASGRSFASVVRKLPLGQPIYSTNGLVPEYSSDMYEEPPLNNAIFAVKPHVLSGPVKIYLGYYIFEVKRIIPATQKTLAQSAAAIRAQLPSELYNQALVSFIKHWRATWTARTDCQPGYVVAKCKQYKAPVGALPEDAYSLD
jgi:parvulin-like peptidyl-prolyl isomerase